MNQIINLTHCKSPTDLAKRFGTDWLYVGGETPEKGGLEGSPLANPFRPISDWNREQVIEAYRRWLWKQIRTGNQAVLSALLGIGEHTALACWCAPKHCHGHVVAKAARWLRSQDMAPTPSGSRAKGAKRPLPTRWAPGQKVADTDAFCLHHTHAKLSRFVKGKAAFLAHRLDSGLWCTPVVDA